MFKYKTKPQRHLKERLQQFIYAVCRGDADTDLLSRRSRWTSIARGWACLESRGRHWLRRAPKDSVQRRRRRRHIVSRKGTQKGPNVAKGGRFLKDKMLPWATVSRKAAIERVDFKNKFVKYSLLESLNERIKYSKQNSFLENPRERMMISYPRYYAIKNQHGTGEDRGDDKTTG
ncbi:hypothetical protein GWI33_015665 [Rhynchophorus ferrugineus]|uniref:Uncharacterized protein n=1 Tax=Rhynchophorus ferrugineus TaxID=354439 RepID=A0A834I2C6_RHYFE|nr:hypothetical protein GWI33_015665 [Rhynchophorus ferrugineus]